MGLVSLGEKWCAFVRAFIAIMEAGQAIRADIKCAIAGGYGPAYT
ncbi:hypothetical protein [Pseudosulfitobacter sp. SM2401]